MLHESNTLLHSYQGHKGYGGGGGGGGHKGYGGGGGGGGHKGLWAINCNLVQFGDTQFCSYSIILDSATNSIHMVCVHARYLHDAEKIKYISNNFVM